MKTQKLKSAGFTLIEMTFTMMLMSMMTIGVVSNLDLGSTSVHLATLKVLHDMRYAQDLAMITGISHGFKTTGSTQYEIYVTSTGTLATNPSTQDPMQIDLVSDFHGTSFSAAYQIEFDSLGKPLIGGGSSVSLYKEATVRNIYVHANTGFIRLP